MSKITSIATAVPAYKQSQAQIFEVVKPMHAATVEEERILRFLYRSSGIDSRYAAVPDFNPANQSNEILDSGGTCTKGLQERLKLYDAAALELSATAILRCLPPDVQPSDITHLITVSCTGMRAPGLDLALIRHLSMRTNIYRTSVNFMGCYAAVHGLKQAHHIAAAEPGARVLVVCVELCTLHFQQDKTPDNITSTIIFGDGAAAVLVEHDVSPRQGWALNGFYSEISFEGIQEMAWDISASGFLMTLTNRVPDILKDKCGQVIENALRHYGVSAHEVGYWCVHPGGKKILEAIEQGSFIGREQLKESYHVLKDYGNMSSPTILFVLEKIIREHNSDTRGKKIVGMAFGPGLTLETFYITHA